MVNSFLLLQEREPFDDYKRLVDVLNNAGETSQKAGIQFCYHNHNFEFKKYEDTTAYDYLLKSVDPKLVKFERRTIPRPLKNSTRRWDYSRPSVEAPLIGSASSQPLTRVACSTLCGAGLLRTATARSSKGELCVSQQLERVGLHSRPIVVHRGGETMNRRGATDGVLSISYLCHKRAIRFEPLCAKSSFLPMKSASVRA